MLLVYKTKNISILNFKQDNNQKVIQLYNIITICLDFVKAFDTADRSKLIIILTGIRIKKSQPSYKCI